MDRRDLAILADLAERALQGELARLAALNARRRRLTEKAATLAATARCEAEAASDVPGLAAYAAWRGWEGRTQRRLAGEEAALAAEMEGVRKRALARLGRREAVGVLARRSAAADRAEERRRIERDGRAPER